MSIHALRLGRAALILMAMGVLAACNVGSKANNKLGEVRFVNLASSVASLNVSLAGTPVASDLGYRAFSSYTERNSDFYETKLSNAAGTVLDTFSLGVSQNKQTVFVLDPLTGTTPRHVGVVDTAVTITAGKFSVRTVKLDAALSPLDLYVTTPTADLAAATPNVYGTSNGVASARMAEADAGSYRVRLTVSGTKNVVFDATVNFVAGSDNVMVLMSAGGSAAVPAVFVYREGDTSVQPLANTASPARIRLVNAAVGPASARIERAGTALIAATDFGKVSDYVVLASGAAPFKALNATTSTLVESDLTLTASEDYTLLLRGDATGYVQQLLPEDARTTSSTTPRVRFVNATAVASVDVVEGTSSVVDGITPGLRSAFKDATSAAHTYIFRQSGTTTVLAQITSDTLLIGANYNFALIGNTGNYKVIAYRSN